jgi:hypothetical protein
LIQRQTAEWFEPVLQGKAMHMAAKLKALVVTAEPPLDRVGLVCLAWMGAFFALTAVLALTMI